MVLAWPSNVNCVQSPLAHKNVDLNETREEQEAMTKPTHKQTERKREIYTQSCCFLFFRQHFSEHNQSNEVQQLSNAFQWHHSVSNKWRREEISDSFDSVVLFIPYHQYKK